MATKDDQQTAAKKTPDTKSAEAPAPVDTVAADAAAAKKAAEDRVIAQKAAEEQCAQTFHTWALPPINPFNSADLTCSFMCKRCGVKAQFTITVG